MNSGSCSQMYVVILKTARCSFHYIPKVTSRHEKAIITTLDVIDGKEQREHAAQLEHFQISMNQLQKHVEWCQGILLRKKVFKFWKSIMLLLDGVEVF